MPFFGRRAAQPPLRCPSCRTPLTWISFNPERRSLAGYPVDAVGECHDHGEWDITIYPPPGRHTA
jgi:hypothetical protein